MGELGLVFVLLIVIYLGECVVWLPDTARAFYAPVSGPWSAATQVFTVASGRWQACVGRLVPGSGGLVATEELLVALGPEGVCVCRSAPGNMGRPLAYERLEPLRAEGRSVRSGRMEFARTAAPAFAQRLVDHVRELTESPAAVRASRIEAFTSYMLDARVARRAVRRYRWCMRGLLWPIRALAGTLFVLLPLSTLGGGLSAALPSVGLALALLGLIAWRFRTRLDRLGTGGPAGNRVAVMLMAPPTALRADDMAGREMFAGIHTLGLALVAAAPEEARSLVSQELRRLHHPLASELEPCCDVARWSRQAWSVVLKTWTAQHFGSVGALLAPPEPESPRCHAFCPRCHQQYGSGVTSCVDCEGMPLVSFSRA